MTENSSRNAPQCATRVRNGSLVLFYFAAVDSFCSSQCPGEPFASKLANRPCTFVELWGGEDVSHRRVYTHTRLTLRYSWSAIFLYVYTGRIAFAPIGSRNAPSKETQGTSEDGQKSSQDRGGPSTTSPGAITVEPCSPKSIYRLANKVRSAPLLGDSETDCNA